MTWAFFVLPLSHLFHPPTEMVQGIWIDVSIGDELGQIKVLRMSRGGTDCQSSINLIQGHRLLLPFDKENSFVLESAGPVGVDDEVAGSILGDHHRLGLILVKEGLGKGGQICNVILLCFSYKCTGFQ